MKGQNFKFQVSMNVGYNYNSEDKLFEGDVYLLSHATVRPH